MHLNDIEVTSFVSELSPSEMWDLLTSATYPKTSEKKIGMGPNLAKLLMSVHGGHFYDIQKGYFYNNHHSHVYSTVVYSITDSCSLSLAGLMTETYSKSLHCPWLSCI